MGFKMTLAANNVVRKRFGLAPTKEITWKCGIYECFEVPLEKVPRIQVSGDFAVDYLGSRRVRIIFYHADDYVLFKLVYNGGLGTRFPDIDRNLWDQL